MTPQDHAIAILEAAWRKADWDYVTLKAKFRGYSETELDQPHEGHQTRRQALTARREAAEQILASITWAKDAQ